jgi:zinc transport system permease protein
MLIGVVSVIGGLVLSYSWDTPAGPSIVVVASFIFAMLHVLPIPPVKG